ncbi:MAG: NCS2 family permease [Candidatus Tectomicrobia bacterium]|nr:NCS2 family permease [Candidatus Tectomicrobia bacterium]
MERFFELQRHGTTVRIEILAGITTFLTAAYIIFVNPSILSETGMDRGALITVTCLISGLATLLLGLWPRVPLMMAPGMGLNAFFTFTLVKSLGLSWQVALGAVFYSGILFLLLTVVGVRERFVRSIPAALRLSLSIGIGLFITLIGLQNLGLVVAHPATFITIGKLKPTVFLGLFGLLVIMYLAARGIRGAILAGILATAILGMLLGYGSTPAGVLSLPPSPAPIALRLDFAAIFTVGLWGAIFTMMFVDLFDSVGTMVGVAYQAGMVQADGSIPKIGQMLAADAMATAAGALLGTSTTTTYIESASGIAQGGRSGLTAVTTGVLFLLAMFFTPLIAVVPTYATAPALIAVGVYMMRGVREIDFTNWEDAFPSFLTIVLMPFTYSISHGLLFGFLSYVLLKLALGKWRDLNLVLYLIAALSVPNLLVS